MSEVKRRAIYFTDEELKALLYSETLARYEYEDGDSEEYQSADKKISDEMERRGLL